MTPLSTTAPIDDPHTAWARAEERWALLVRRRAALDGRRTAVAAERARVQSETQQALERLQAQDLVRAVLEGIQQREHERAVGAYEALLGAFLSDVLPGERQVSMDLHTERGAPALDVFIRKGGPDAPLEDAWLGTGGSVTNLLSTGLRLVALLRSGQRKFLVLDESDCWIKPDLIPRYANVVAQMARELGVQILMISHHAESLFEADIPNRLRLTRLGQGPLSTEWSPTSAIPVWDSEQTGLRSITLRNFQSHQNTHIPLAPGVTLLQGDNDIGKSVVVNALRAVFDGDANDSLVRHGTNESQVVIDLGPEHIVTWTRYRKGKVKCAYRLSTPEGATLHASEGTRVPEWLATHVRVGRVDGLDIQIGQQQEPVFLLNQPPGTRAKALAIGQESGHVQSMMQIDRQEVADARAAHKAGERTLELLRRQQLALEGLETAPESIDGTAVLAGHRTAVAQQDRWGSLFHRWRTASQRHQVLRGVGPAPRLVCPTPRAEAEHTLMQRWRAAAHRRKALAALGSALPALRAGVPEARAQSGLRLIARWTHQRARAAAVQRMGVAPVWGALPTDRAAAWRAVAARWAPALHRLAVLNALAQRTTPVWPALHSEDARTTERLVQRWRNADDEHQRARSEAQDLEETLVREFPLCPTCQQAWPHRHQEGAP